MSDEGKSPRWRWRWSGWTGVMYGPLPVGLTLVLIAFGYLVWHLLGR